MGVEPTLFHLASGRFTTKLHPQSAIGSNYIPHLKRQTSKSCDKIYVPDSRSGCTEQAEVAELVDAQRSERCEL